MEQEPENTPNPNEETNVNSHQGRDIEVSVSEDELKALDALGPDSDEVKKWLSDNNITENDRIVANGNVYVAAADDFLTRDIAATESWASAARAIVDLEGSIDAHTAEIVEEEPRITEQQAEKIGDEALEAAEVEEPATLADIMSGKRTGPLKFDMEAAAERLRIEDEARLVPLAEVNKARPVLSEMQRQFDIAMTADIPQEADSLRHNLEGALVQQSRQVAEEVHRGEMNPMVAAMMEGAFMGFARTPEGLDAVKQNILNSELYNDEEKASIEQEVATLTAYITQHGAEGEHFASYGFDLEQKMNQTYNANNMAPNKVYATLMGMLVGTSGRISPDMQGHAYMRLQGGLDHMASFKKADQQ